MTQVMAKRKARSQIDNLTPDHYKSGIDLTPMCAGECNTPLESFQGELSKRVTNLLQTSSQSKV